MVLRVFRVLMLLCLSVGLAHAELAMAPSSYDSSPVSKETLKVSRVLVDKSDRVLRLMADGRAIREYRISLGDRPEGHKLWEGDERTPEGVYTLDWRNPNSEFYRSIHISYPSAQDRELAKAWGLDPGGNIMIHGLPNDVGDMAFAYKGLDWTDGCIAVTNEAIDEIWELVADGTVIEIQP